MSSDNVTYVDFNSVEDQKQKDREQIFKSITDNMIDVYHKKNTDYGNSFGNSMQEFGIISSVIRIGDKYNRMKSIVKNNNCMVAGEKLEDTLLDMANYAIMTLVELKSA